MLRRSILHGILFCLIPGFLLAEDNSFSSLQRRVLEVFQEHSNAVVRVKGVPEEDAERRDHATGMRVGTGFIISRDGHVLTNASVAHGSARLWGEHNGIHYSLEPIGHDLLTNLSLLKFNRLPDEFGIIHLEEAPRRPPVGSFLLSISLPLEFGPTPNWGLLGGQESYFGNRFFPTTYLRVGIPAAPGAGGSPVFDLQGNFLGMVVASLPDLNSSYVLPTRALMKVRDDLLFRGEVVRAFLGVEINEQSGADIGRQVIVSDVMEGGPAWRAGLRVNDVLVEFADRPIKRFDDFVETVFFLRPGQEVHVVSLRNGESRTGSVRVESRQDYIDQGVIGEDQDPVSPAEPAEPAQGTAPNEVQEDSPSE